MIAPCRPVVNQRKIGRDAAMMIDYDERASTIGEDTALVQITITCGEYRGGRRLLALKRRLDQEAASLSERERREIETEIAELERQLGMD